MKDFHIDSIKLAEYIKTKRTELNLTQEELSEKSGIDYKHIQSMESYRKKNDPKYSTLCKLAEALDIDIIELIVQMNKHQYHEEDISKIFWLVSENRRKNLNK